MLKYIKLLMSCAVFSAFTQLSHAQGSKSKDKELSKEEEAMEKLLTLPSVFAPSVPTAVETNDIVRVQSIPGIDASTAAALGSSGLNTLIAQTTGDAATRATQLKTLINLVDVYSNTSDSSNVGRRAINASADLSSIISSISATITTDHLDTLSNLDTTHMSTFASDGLSNICCRKLSAITSLIIISLPFFGLLNLHQGPSPITSALNSCIATAYPQFRNAPSVNFIIFPLCTKETDLRSLSIAY